MKAVLIGSVSSSAAALRGMRRGKLKLAGVLGLNRTYAGQVSDYCDLEPLARKARAPYLAFDKITDPQVMGFLDGRKFDWLFVIGLSQLVPPAIRQMARAGAVGFHPTPLPEGRGRAPVAWTILLQRPAAANLFFLADEADAGDIIEQRPVEVLPGDYAADLIERTNVVLEEMIADLAPAFTAGNVPHRPQDHSKATYYERRRPEDGLINWNQSAEAIHRLIRAVSHPYPGAFTYCEGKKLIIWRAEPVESTELGLTPGVVAATCNDEPVIQTRKGLLHLTETEMVDNPGMKLAVGQKLG
jgi:methionyl-tRNA formyltransferase